MSCPRCPHCIASGAFGLIDPRDPALVFAPAPTPKRKVRDRAAEKDAIESLRSAYMKIFQIGYARKDDGLMVLGETVAHLLGKIQMRWM